MPSNTPKSLTRILGRPSLPKAKSSLAEPLIAGTPGVQSDHGLTRSSDQSAAEGECYVVSPPNIASPSPGSPTLSTSSHPVFRSSSKGRSKSQSPTRPVATRSSRDLSSPLRRRGYPDLPSPAEHSDSVASGPISPTGYSTFRSSREYSPSSVGNSPVAVSFSSRRNRTSSLSGVLAASIGPEPFTSSTPSSLHGSAIDSWLSHSQSPVASFHETYHRGEDRIQDLSTSSLGAAEVYNVAAQSKSSTSPTDYILESRAHVSRQGQRAVVGPRRSIHSGRSLLMLPDESPPEERNATVVPIVRSPSRQPSIASERQSAAHVKLPRSLQPVSNPNFDQLFYNFFNKTTLLVSEARVTAPGPLTAEIGRKGKQEPQIDAWFNLETPDSRIFKKELEAFKFISTSLTRSHTNTTSAIPPLHLSIYLSIPRAAINQVLVLAHGNHRVRIEPIPRYILLESWCVELDRPTNVTNPGGSENVPPQVYNQAVSLFRALYTLLRILPTTNLQKRLRRSARTSSAGSLAVEMKLKVGSDPPISPSNEQPRSQTIIVDFDTPLSRDSSANAKDTFSFPAIDSLMGTLKISVTYRRQISFAMESWESLLSSDLVSSKGWQYETYSIPPPESSRLLSQAIRRPLKDESFLSPYSQLSEASDVKITSKTRTSTEPLQTSEEQSTKHTGENHSFRSRADSLISESDSTIEDITGSVSLLYDYPIGYGGFGDVFVGQHTTVGKVALKRPRFERDDSSIIRRFHREANLWCQISHPNILPFLGTCIIKSEIYMVSPFIENGDLASCLRKGRSVDRGKMIRQIAGAVDHLHIQGVVHGDIKAQNVLLSKDGSALLCDFGLSKAFGCMMTSSESKGRGSTRWMAPELFEAGQKTVASDVYAFGMTIAEILSGKPPFADIPENNGVMYAVLLKDARPPRVPAKRADGRSYDKIWEAAESCWAREVSDRPSMGQVSAVLNRATRA